MAPQSKGKTQRCLGTGDWITSRVDLARVPLTAQLDATGNGDRTAVPSTPRCGFVAADHFVDPDWGVGRGAAGGGGVVDQHLELFADGDGALSEFGVADADLGEAVVHGPLLLLGRALH